MADSTNLPDVPTFTAGESDTDITASLNQYLTGVNTAYTGTQQNLLDAEQAVVNQSNTAAATAAASTTTPLSSISLPLILVGGAILFLIMKGKL